MSVLIRLHRDEDAQISFLALAATVCFVALLAMVINTSDMVDERVHMQDVADATVLSAASWSARGLNVLSFINVLNSKLLSTAVLLNSLNDAIPIIIKVGEIQKAIFQGCTGVPFVGPFCAAMAAIIQVQLAALRTMKSALQTAVNTLSKCRNGQLWNLMKVLERSGEGIKRSFVLIAVAESREIARANGATDGLVVNGKLLSSNPSQGLELPALKGNKKQDFQVFCDKMKNGGSGYKLQGYNCGQGPLELGKERVSKLLYPFYNLGGPPIFKGMVTKNMLQLGCKPGKNEEDEKIEVQLENLAECKRYKSTAKWTHTRSFTGEVTEGGWSYADFVPWRPKKGDSSAETDDVDDELLEAIQGLGQGSAQPGEQSDLVFKDGYKALLASTEDSQGPINVSCTSGSYPYFDRTLQRVVGFDCNSLISTCERVDKMSEFKWISSGKGTGISAGGYFIKVEKEELQPKEEGGDKLYKYQVDVVTLTSAGTKEMTQKEFEDYMKDKDVEMKSDGNTKGCNKPFPWLLDKSTGYQDRLRFIGAVYKNVDEDPPFWNTFFSKPESAYPPPRIIAYAQAQVYNYLSEDLFTQDWRVRLEQATLLSSFLSSDKENTPSSGMTSSNFVDDFIESVNNH